MISSLASVTGSRKFGEPDKITLTGFTPVQNTVHGPLGAFAYQLGAQRGGAGGHAPRRLIRVEQFVVFMEPATADPERGVPVARDHAERLGVANGLPLAVREQGARS
ncbi:hypothetical protein ACWD6P_12885 [Streptomyces sp. NPDC002446]